MIGLEKGLKLAGVFAGEKIYIPQTRRVSVKLIHQKIQSEFTGANIGELVKKYGYTETWIRQIVGQPKARHPEGGRLLEAPSGELSTDLQGDRRGCGLEAASGRGGKRIFVPELVDTLSRKKKREAIKSEFNGHNVKELARRYGIYNKNSNN